MQTFDVCISAYLFLFSATLVIARLHISFTSVLFLITHYLATMQQYTEVEEEAKCVRLEERSQEQHFVLSSTQLMIYIPHRRGPGNHLLR